MQPVFPLNPGCLKGDIGFMGCHPGWNELDPERLLRRHDWRVDYWLDHGAQASNTRHPANRAEPRCR